LNCVVEALKRVDDLLEHFSLLGDDQGVATRLVGDLALDRRLTALQGHQQPLHRRGERGKQLVALLRGRAVEVSERRQARGQLHASADHGVQQRIASVDLSARAGGAREQATLGISVIGIGQAVEWHLSLVETLELGVLPWGQRRVGRLAGWVVRTASECERTGEHGSSRRKKWPASHRGKDTDGDRRVWLAPGAAGGY